MALPIILPVTQIGSNRQPCGHTVRVAASPTRASLYGALERERKGLPTDQCGRRSDFLVDGVPMCRPHAGQMALKALVDVPASRPDAFAISLIRAGLRAANEQDCPRSHSGAKEAITAIVEQAQRLTGQARKIIVKERRLNRWLKRITR